MGAQLLEVDWIFGLLVNQLNDKALWAFQEWWGVVRNGDVHLADGDIAVVVIGEVFNHHVLKGGQGKGETLWLNVSPCNTSRVIHCNGLGEVDGKENAIG